MNAYYSLADVQRYQDEFRRAAALDRLATRVRRSRRQAGATPAPAERPRHAA